MLMPADRKARIAYELIAVAPGAPLMLWAMVGLPLGGDIDRPIGQPLGLTSQPATTPKGQP